MDYDIFIKILFLFLLAIVPSLAWLGFFLRKDGRPEPRRFILLSFIIGGIMAIIASEAENKWFPGFVQNNSNLQIGAFLFFVFYPLLEEILKFLAGRSSTIKNKYFLDEKTDPMIYMITAGLGFAAFENIKIFFTIVFGADIPNLMNISHIDISQTTLFSLLSIAFLRFISTVLLHAFCSGILGFFWATIRLTEQKIKMVFISIPTGFIMATAVHALFNYLISQLMNNNFICIAPLAVLLIVVGLITRKCFYRLASS